MTGTDLRELLTRVAEDIPEVDLAERSWQGAVEAGRRRRQRVLSGIAAGAAAAVAIGVVVSTSGSRPATRLPATRTTAPPAVAGGGVLVTATDGTPVTVAPSSADFARLPLLHTALPERIGWSGPLRRLSDVVGPQRRDDGLTVRAVLLTPTGPATWQPVLLTEGASGTGYLLVDQVELRDDRPAGTDRPFAPPLVAGAVAEGGRRVLFVHRASVEVLDVGSGTVRSVPVPGVAAGDSLVDGGWLADGAVLVRTEAGSWRVDPGSGAVTRASTTSWPQPWRIIRHEGQLSLVGGNRAGETTTSTPFDGPVGDPWGATVSNGLWAATGTFPDSTLLPPSVGPVVGGVSAVDVPDLRQQRALVFPGNEPGVLKGGARAVGFTAGGFASSGLLVVEYDRTAPDRTWLLGWDLATGRLYRIGEVTGAAARGAGGQVGQVVAVGALGG